MLADRWLLCLTEDQTMPLGRKKLNPHHLGGRIRKSRRREALNYLFRSDRYLHETGMKATELVVGRLR